jgi:predicted Rossmann fold nucleotide-binding protein DprA/Smf involved in DNA uptake
VFAPVELSPQHSTYPTALVECWAHSDLPVLHAIGNCNLLQQPAIALFCSVKCPGDLILKTYDLAQALRDAQIPVISGFHSPMEKECLRLLLRGTQPIIHCPARSLHTMRLAKDQKAAIAANQLLLLSPFAASQKRATTVLADKRNQLVGAIAKAVFIAYAAPSGKTEAFVQHLVRQGKPLFTFDSPDTQNLLNFSAKTLTSDTAAPVLHRFLNSHQ